MNPQNYKKENSKTGTLVVNIVAREESSRLLGADLLAPVLPAICELLQPRQPTCRFLHPSYVIEVHGRNESRTINIHHEISQIPMAYK